VLWGKVVETIKLRWNTKRIDDFFKYAELEQAAALKYLYGWLRHHPKYGTLASPELSDSLYYADVSVCVFFPY
jgi:hypothetical protein